MKIIIEIPEKTNSHIRSDYGHGVKGLRDEDREIVCDAIYNGIHYEASSNGEWIPCKDDNFCKCSECKQIVMSEERSNFCPNCGANMRVKNELNRVSKQLNS